MTRVGIVGIGFMGMIHFLNYREVDGIEVVAIASRSEKKRKGDWRGIQGNFGPPGEEMDLSGIKTYETLEEMLADPDIDAIDVTLPPYQHFEATRAALDAGKHVFCEKPLTLDTASSADLVAHAQSTGRQLLVGHVLPFFPEYQWARQTIDSGQYGKLLGGSFYRVISDPAWLEDYWNPERVGGPMLDLHVHDAHFIRLLFGMPRSVMTQGRMRGECAEAWTSLMQFDDPQLVVSATSGTIASSGRPFRHAFEIQLEQATLAFDFAVAGEAAGYLCEPTLYGPEGVVTKPDLGNGDPMFAFQRQITEVARAVQSGAPSPILSGELAGDAIRLCQLQQESLLAGKPVSV